MKEYEYNVEALEGYLCEELTGVICSENYRNKSYEYGYRHIFKEYRKLHEDFCANRERFADQSQEQGAREEFQHQCEVKRKEILDDFLKDIQACTSVDIKSSMDNYLQKLEAEEAKTVAKRICLYPYLVSVLEWAERENNSLVRNFSEQFHVLINEDVSRKPLKSQESRKGRLDERNYGKMLDDYDEKFPVPEDGFIAHYCREN